MALTFDQICTIACETAHSPGKIGFARQFLNQILSDLCEQYDFADARGIYLFNFNPSLSSATLPGGQFGSGPYGLPLDYLRASGSSGSSGSQKFAIWYLNGTPYPMIPCDLAEFDIQIQQAGLQSYPWMVTTNMGDVVTDRFSLVTSGGGQRDDHRCGQQRRRLSDVRSYTIDLRLQPAIGEFPGANPLPTADAGLSEFRQNSVVPQPGVFAGKTGAANVRVE